jgi:hypothetical protein
MTHERRVVCGSRRRVAPWWCTPGLRLVRRADPRGGPPGRGDLLETLPPGPAPVRPRGRPGPGRGGSPAAAAGLTPTRRTRVKRSASAVPRFTGTSHPCPPWKKCERSSSRPPIASHEPVMPGLNGTLCMLCGLDRASHAPVPAARRSGSRWSARRRSLWPNDLDARRRTGHTDGSEEGPRHQMRC